MNWNDDIMVMIIEEVVVVGMILVIMGSSTRDMKVMGRTDMEIIMEGKEGMEITMVYYLNMITIIIGMVIDMATSNRMEGTTSLLNSKEWGSSHINRGIMAEVLLRMIEVGINNLLSTSSHSHSRIIYPRESRIHINSSLDRHPHQHPSSKGIMVWIEV